jgi:hypothetical protein
MLDDGMVVLLGPGGPVLDSGGAGGGCGETADAAGEGAVACGWG